MEILNQFGINPLLLAAQVVNFGILLLILKKFLFKPILKVLEERKSRIEGSLKNAEEIEIKLARTNEKIDQMLSQALEEGQKIREQSKKEAALFLEETKQKGAILAEEIIKKGEDALKVERQNLQKEVKMELAELVTLALHKVTNKVISKKDQKDLIERSIGEIS